MSAIYKNFQTDANNEVERIFAMPFKDCALYISKMDTMKKADIAAQIQPILTGLYLQADRYGNPNYGRDEQIGPDIFNHIMGRIKRWETVLYWLYEIDILMEETELDEQVRAAEKKMEALEWDQEAIHKRVVPNVEGLVSPKSGKVTKNITIQVTYSDEYTELVKQRERRGNHTNDIMSMASSLASKYFSK